MVNTSYSKIYGISKYILKNPKAAKRVHSLMKQARPGNRNAGLLYFGVFIENLIQLEGYGINVKLYNRNSIKLSGWPYLRHELTIEGASPNELLNLVVLVRLSVKYGVAIYQSAVDEQAVPLKTVVIDTKKKIVTVDGNINFHLDAIDPWIIMETFYLNIHNFGNIKNMKVVDVGAAFGDSALYFAKHGAKVYAIEPVNYDAMIRNLKLNPHLSKKISPLRYAVGADGKLRFSVLSNMVDGGASAFSMHQGDSTVEVDGYTFRSLLDKLGINAIEIAKFDCKGCEHRLTKEDLVRVKRYVSIEYGCSALGELEHLTNLLKESGFEYSVYLHSPEAISLIQNHATILAKRS